MPANLFARWAGVEPHAQDGVSPATAVTGNEKPSDPAALVDMVEVADAALIAATASPPNGPEVTAVADPLEPWLPQKPTQKQCGIRRNRGNLEVWALSARLDVGEPSAWRMLFDTRLTYRQRSAGRCWSEAECLAFDCLVEWHRRCAKRPDTDRCAGCGEVLPNGVGLIVDRDDIRVHFDVVRGFDCLTAYGQRWRSAAVAGLHDIGLDPPASFQIM
jgi:hypothetical protein